MELNVNNFYVLAVFKVNNYAGERTYNLEKVFCGDFAKEELEKYNSYEYVIRTCKLSDII